MATVTSSENNLVKGNDSALKDNNKEDDELDALLDDALEDFQKPNNASEQQPSKEKANISNNLDADPLIDNILNDDSLSQMTDGFDQFLGQMAQSDPAMMAEFQKFQAMSSANNGEAKTPFGIDENIAKTMDELSKNLQGLETNQDNPSMEEMMKQLQKEMGGDEQMYSADNPPPSTDSFMGMMQGMMDNLLSKEMLYPSIKEIEEKYPKWLADNKGKISNEDYEKYRKQEKIVHQLCLLFESESENAEKESSGKVVDLMQQMQQYGHPPADMMTDIVGGEQGPPMPECSIM